MAPEQVTGRDTLSQRVDIYSLGLVLCEMATNKPVFAAANIEALLYQVLNGDVSASAKTLRKVAPNLYPVVIKALQQNPSERFQTAAEMSERLREVWWGLGGRQRMGLVVQATRNLVPHHESVPTLKPTIATAAVTDETTAWQLPEERAAGPATWSNFCQAFADQIPAEPPDVDTASTTVPVRRRPERTLLPILLGIVAVLAVALIAVSALPRLFGASAPVDESMTVQPVDPSVVSNQSAADELPGIVADVEGSDPAPDIADATPPPPPQERVTPPPPPPPQELPVAATEAPVTDPTPTAATADTGRLQINSVPWSEVYVGKVNLGRTGAPTFELPVGAHRVRLEQPQTNQVKHFDIYISKDATVNVGCWNFETSSECGG